MYAVSNHGDVGTWIGDNFKNLGKLGGWGCKQIAFDNKGQLWAVGGPSAGQLDVGLWKSPNIENPGDQTMMENKGKLGGWTWVAIAFNPLDTGKEQKKYAVSNYRDVGEFHDGKMTMLSGDKFIPRQTALNIAFDQKGQLWVVTTSRELECWDLKEKKKLKSYGKPAGWDLASVHFDQQNRMWCIGTSQEVGLYYFDKETGKGEMGFYNSLGAGGLWGLAFRPVVKAEEILKAEEIPGTGKGEKVLVGVSNIEILYPGDTTKVELRNKKASGVKVGNEIEKGSESSEELGGSLKITTGVEGEASAGVEGVASAKVKSKLEVEAAVNYAKTKTAREAVKVSDEKYKSNEVEGIKTVEAKCEAGQMKIVITQVWVDRYSGTMMVDGVKIPFADEKMRFEKMLVRAYTLPNKDILNDLKEYRKKFENLVSDDDIKEVRRFNEEYQDGKNKVLPVNP